MLRGGMEVVVLAMAALSPWAFGGVDPVFELALDVGLFVLLGLWVALAIAAGRLTIARCPVTLVLALLFLAGLLQLLPLPSGLLRIVSPGTSEIREEIYPAKPEQLAPNSTAAGAPTRTVSVYPHATRIELFRWLGILVLFAAVRNQIASTESLWRLSLLMLVNGCLLALFGLAQFFSVKNKVYWAFTASEPFGPFINRNHFAAYLNMCLALGVGLLVWLGPSEQDRKQRYMVKPNAPDEQTEVFGMLLAPLRVLHSPTQLWTLAAVSIMGAATLCSLSRGGVVAIFIALIATLCLRLTWPIRVRRLEVLIVPVLLIIGLFAFLQFRPLETRLGTLFKFSDSALDARWTMWGDLIKLVPRFWLLGSGYGTLGYVEPLTRQPATFAEPSYFVEHAHNDYLEALVEGGAIRFGLTLLLVGLIFAAGFRGLRRYIGRTPGALAVGAMAGFLAIALHSAVDFSLTTPAVAILAAVVVAQLVALNRPDPTRSPADDHARVHTLHLGVPGRLAVGLTGATLGLLLMIHAWQADRTHRLKLAAFSAARKSEPPDRETAIKLLEAAAAVTPDDAELQSDLGQEYLDLGRAEREYAHLRTRTATGPFWLAIGANSPIGTAVDLVRWRESPLMDLPLTAQKRSELSGEFTVPGLAHLAEARRLCPLLPRPEMRFAAYASELTRADPPRRYWERALYLAPFDADLWYFAGFQAFNDGRTDEAWSDWKKSLEMRPSKDQLQRRPARLADMVAAVSRKFGPDRRRVAEQMLEHVLPDQPEDLVTVAHLLDPDLSATGPARSLMSRAAKVFGDRTEGMSPEQYHLKALVYAKLDEPEPAIKAYAQALALSPNQDRWRLEYARLLRDERRWKEAAHELGILWKRQPQPQEVKDMLDEVDRQRKIDITP
jgi:O-antigen ligase/tetratricopeptide (TPR) repeat protein